MKKVPNILSCCRIIISIVLLFCIDKKLLFLILYVVAGITDVLDGFIARRFNAQTAIGAKLDSIADFIFFLAAFITLIFYIDITNMFVIIGLAAVVIIRGFNLIFTKIKFKKFGMIHTVANKITGLLIFISVPVFVWLQRLSYPILIPIFILALISAFEESVILIINKQYDVNCKSLFNLVKR